MKILIESIPHNLHRYSTTGDYYEKDGIEHVIVSELADKRMMQMVVLHELIEKFLTEARGIKEEDILVYDTAHADSDEPGDEPDAPYYKEHFFAETVERLICGQFGINWDEYCDTIASLYETKDN